MEITKRSHPSGGEDPVRQYVVDTAQNIASVVFYEADTADPGERVIVLQRAGSGAYIDQPYVTLQAHLDMVCYPDDDIFPLDVFSYDDDGVTWIKAGDRGSVGNPNEGTTLGADDGIGVATILAILEDEELREYPIECLFTVQEESDMGGAQGFDPTLLQGRTYINLDAEDENIIIYGSAGGCDVHYENSSLTRDDGSLAGHTMLQVSISGLAGGHSGININNGRLNAIKVLTSTLMRLNQRVTNTGATRDIGAYDIRLVDMSRNETARMNSIPSSAVATIAIPQSTISDFQKDFETLCDAIRSSYQPVEKNFGSNVEETSTEEHALDPASTDAVLCLLHQIPHGVVKMIPTAPDIVETSTNLANVVLNGTDLTVTCSNRSSEQSTLKSLKSLQLETGRCFDCTVRFDNDYPAWQPNDDSKVLAMARNVYEEQYGKDFNATVIHAGLECGYVVQKYLDAPVPMDCISIGPTIQDPHTGAERLESDSVARSYQSVTTLIKRIFARGQASD